MFLRRCERRTSGKRHTARPLVESYRTARGSRQRVVAYLGDLAPSEQDGWAKLGAHLQGDEASRRPERTLFDPPCARDAGEEEQVKVRLKDIRLERLRDFGDVWLAWGLWRMLGLDRLLPHKEAIESHLKQRFGELFELKERFWLSIAGIRRHDQEAAAADRETASGGELGSQREVPRVVAAGRRLLPPADESHRRRSGHALEAIHPAHRGGMGLQDRAGRTGDSARVTRTPSGRRRRGRRRCCTGWGLHVAGGSSGSTGPAPMERRLRPRIRVNSRLYAPRCGPWVRRGHLHPRPESPRREPGGSAFGDRRTLPPAFARALG